MEATTWRQRYVAETKKQVVAAARRLFVASGYAGTTIDAIAAEAGVAVATVYKAFGTKAAIARQLNDLIDDEAGSSNLAEEIGTETDPTHAIGRVVSPMRTQHERCGDIIRAIRQAAEVDATPREVWDEGTRRYDDDLRTLVRRLKAFGALRTSVTETEAIGLLSVLCSTETFTVLTSRHGWTPAQWEARTASALAQLLLEDSAKGSETRPRTSGRARRAPRR